MNVTLAVTYPNFQPAVTDGGRLKDNQIYIHISPTCGETMVPSEEDESKRFSTYITNNAGYMDKNGKHQFASVKYLGNNIYFQENIQEPYMDGNGSIYFYKDSKDKVLLFHGCDGTRKCYSNDTRMLNGDYGVYYVSKGISYEEYFNLHQQVKKFVSGLYKGSLDAKQ